jgi:AbrB family looped-hinge helix DNA binding protein
VTTVTVSPKFQVVIPREIREAMGLKAGEKLGVLSFGDRIELVVLRPMKKLRGLLKGMDTRIDREEDRP